MTIREIEVPSDHECHRALVTSRIGHGPSVLTLGRGVTSPASAKRPRDGSPRSSRVGRSSGRTATYSAPPAANISRNCKRPGRRYGLLAYDIEPRPTRTGAAWNRERLRKIDLHWHDLRDEGACRLLANGADIRIIQLMLGHASIMQTQRYLNVTTRNSGED